MFRNFLLTALRQLWRHKLHTLINVLSLAIGLTVFVFCFLYVKTEFSYDRSWPDAERIHRLTLDQRGIPGMGEGEYTTLNARAWPPLLEYFSREYEHISRVSTASVRVLDAEGEAQGLRGLYFVDEDFFDIFQFEVIQGSMQKVRENPGVIAVSEETAAALGELVAVGERVVLQSQVTGTQIEYEIGAHYRPPGAPVSPGLRFHMLARIDDRSLPLFRSEDSQRRTSSWEDNVSIWLKLREGLSTDDFNAQQPRFLDETVTAFNGVLGEGARISDHLVYTWQPVTQMHFNPVAFEGNSTGAGDPMRVATFAIVGGLILLVGCSNSVSLSLAAAIERRREIGIRKAAGALPGDVMRQYLGEALLLGLLALVPTAVALHALLPNITQLSPYTFFAAPLALGAAEYAWLVGIALGVGLLSGLYPALVLSRVRAQHALKPGAAHGSRSSQRLRNVLVATQFCFAAVLLIATSALYMQLQITRKQPLGYDSSNMLFAFLATGTRAESGGAVVNDLKSMAGVDDVMIAQLPPNMNLSSTSAQELIRRDAEETVARPQRYAVQPGFFEFIGVPVLAGRAFDFVRDTGVLGPGAAGADGGSPPARVMINASAARALRFSSPQEAVGSVVFWRIFNSRTNEAIEQAFDIIGVVADSMYTSVSRRPEPEMYLLFESSNVVLVRFDPRAANTIQEAITASITRTTSMPPQGVTFLDVYLANAFRQQANESRLLLICGALALLLACTGLFGLASFTIERNLKEVGVRKVLGSTVGAIVRLYLRRFSLPVLVAGVLAWPVAAWFILQWIEQFPYQMDKAWLLPIGLGTIAVILGIAVLSVGYITLKAALSRPVHCLRDE